MSRPIARALLRLLLLSCLAAAFAWIGCGGDDDGGTGGVAQSGDGTPCNYDQTCTSSDECCSGFCAESQVCLGASPCTCPGARPCAVSSTACQENGAQFCDGAWCVFAFDNGAVCSRGAQCGSGSCIGEECVCAPPGTVVPPDNSTFCCSSRVDTAGACTCNPFGVTCARDGDCCFGGCSPAGKCTCASRGAPCSDDHTCCSGRCVDGACGCAEVGTAADQVTAASDCCGGAFANNVGGNCGSGVGSPCKGPGDCDPATTLPPEVCGAGHCCILTGSMPDDDQESSCCSGAWDAKGACTCGKPGDGCASGNDCCIGTCAAGTCVCAPSGAACASPGDCCTQSCESGACACLPVTSTCATSDDCCSRVCQSGACAAAPAGGECAESSDCTSGVCIAGTCVCSAVAGAVCDHDAFCCSGRCVNGSCACAPPGTSCTTGDECCSTSCSGNQCACGAAGTTCQLPTDCCSSSCAGGVCVCAATGALCDTDALCCSTSCSGGHCL